jgi:hypothetical protein
MGWKIQESNPGTDKSFLSSPKPSTIAQGPTQPRIQCILRALSLEMKHLRHESDLSLPSNAGIKNELSYTPLSLCLLGRYRGDFTLFSGQKESC